MAPLAQTLALLAMAVVATMAFNVLPLDMSQDYLRVPPVRCGGSSNNGGGKARNSDFHMHPEFAKSWAEAEAEWQRRGSDPSPLTKDEAVALMAYSMNFTGLYRRFNDATREAGSSSEKYQNKNHFKSLHFLLTRALQKLKPDKCQDVYGGVSGVEFNTKPGMKVLFGQFASTSLSKEVPQDFGQGTVFEVHTCHGVDIQEFSYNASEAEVLIPPFETFNVTSVSKEGNTTYIELRSTGTVTEEDCELPNGGGLTMNSPHLVGLLLATVATAVVTGTL